MSKGVASILIILFGVSEIFSQKIVEKRIEASKIEKVIINGNAIHKISIRTEKTEEIEVLCHIEGESYENIILTTFEADNILTVGTSTTPYFVVENDKLAAHKVMYIEVMIVLPEHLNVFINSEIAAVETEGNYKYLYLLLENGNCIISHFSGDANIQSKHGDIFVYAEKNVSGRAISKYGNVINTLHSGGKFNLMAESRDGNISLIETK